MHCEDFFMFGIQLILEVGIFRSISVVIPCRDPRDGRSWSQVLRHDRLVKQLSRTTIQKLYFDEICDGKIS